MESDHGAEANHERQSEPVCREIRPPDPLSVTVLHDLHARELRRFLIGLLRDPNLAEDVLQTTFAKLIQSPPPDPHLAIKAWLFQVAYHEAITVRRRRASHDRAGKRWLEIQNPVSSTQDDPLVRAEQIERVREAIDRLPPEQRRVLRARVYHDKPFAEIARDLKLPLGTVLSRMRLALKRLRTTLNSPAVADDPNAGSF